MVERTGTKWQKERLGGEESLYRSPVGPAGGYAIGVRYTNEGQWVTLHILTFHCGGPPSPFSQTMVGPRGTGTLGTEARVGCELVAPYRETQ